MSLVNDWVCKYFVKREIEDYTPITLLGLGRAF